jgi:hypothetical protein
MKHLRRFNESLKLDELKDFCETYLAYLMDEGFEVKFDEPDDYDKSTHIWLEKKGDKEIVPNSGIYRSVPFSWDEVKDSFIPFVIMLSKNYEMCIDHSEMEKGKSIVVNTTSSDNFEFSVDEIKGSDSKVMPWGSTISDDLSEELINSIAIVIKDNN